jgi:hypothetical protein
MERCRAARVVVYLLDVDFDRNRYGCLTGVVVFDGSRSGTDPGMAGLGLRLPPVAGNIVLLRDILDASRSRGSRVPVTSGLPTGCPVSITLPRVVRVCDPNRDGSRSLRNTDLRVALRDLCECGRGGRRRSKKGKVQMSERAQTTCQHVTENKRPNKEETTHTYTHTSTVELTHRSYSRPSAA